jgi:hypothetical protein
MEGGLVNKSLFPKWRGKFVFNKQDFVLYRHAESEDQAKFLMTKAIAKIQGVLPVVVRGWLKEHPGSYKIEIEMEYKEIEPSGFAEQIR